MKRKILAGILCAGLFAMSLAGCGSTGTDTTTDSGAASDDGGSVTNSDATYSVGVCQLVQHPALDEATQGFKDALEERLGDDVSIDVQNASGDTATCSTINNGFVSQGVDLIMANATPALQSATAATADIPIVATSITDYATALELDDWSGATGTNVTGTSDLPPLDEQAAMLNENFPDADTVGIVYCSAEPNSKYQADNITPELESLGYTVEEFTFADSNDVATVTQTACDACEVLYIPTDNTAASCAENINNVALPAGVPIVAGEEGICLGCGTVTLSISYYDIGFAAGEMAYEILVNGGDPATMDIQMATDVTKMYNADICDELGIEVPDDYVAIEADEE